MKKFENKVVIVTGAGGGIGSVTAKAFAKEGAKVAIVDFNAELAAKTCNEIKADCIMVCNLLIIDISCF